MPPPKNDILKGVFVIITSKSRDARSDLVFGLEDVSKNDNHDNGCRGGKNNNKNKATEPRKTVAALFAVVRFI